MVTELHDPVEHEAILLHVICVYNFYLAYLHKIVYRLYSFLKVFLKDFVLCSFFLVLLVNNLSIFLGYYGENCKNLQNLFVY